MRKRRLIALLLAVPLLLCACSAKGKTYPYPTGEHTHIYGAWYDVVAVTCLDAGEHICYCKLCGAPAVEVVPVAVELAARAHDFEDTVVPPSESIGGYTRRVCRLCSFVVERANEVPAKYGLALPAEPLAYLSGVEAQLAFGTARQEGGNVILAAAGCETEVNALPALYLAVALVTAEAVSAGDLAWEDTVTVTEGLLAGRENGGFAVGMAFSISELVQECLAPTEKSQVAVAALATRLAGAETELLSRLNARMGQLGARNMHFQSLPSASGGTVGSASLLGTATLLWRVLEEPALAERLVGKGSFAGKPLVLYFAVDGLRLSAVRLEEGYFLAALAGAELPAGAEATVYGGI